MNYFKPHRLEVRGKKTIYDYLGIKIFKKYLITDGDIVRKRRNIKQLHLQEDGRLVALEKAERQTRKFELIHLIFLAITILIIVLNYSNLSIQQWVMINLINLYANIYPIFLQRYNRIRIMRVLEKQEQKPH